MERNPLIALLLVCACLFLIGLRQNRILHENEQ